jgi:hypothetical protein
MKKGKTIKLSGFDRAKVLYGTVDCKNLKSIYLNIQTWGLPKSYKENWNKTILLLQREIKSNVLEEIDKTILQDKIIVDLDMRSSGVQVGKKSFMNLEITFYTKGDLDFRDNIIKNEMKNITKVIYKHNMLSNNDFEFSLTKTDKTII